MSAVYRSRNSGKRRGAARWDAIRAGNGIVIKITIVWDADHSNVLAEVQQSAAIGDHRLSNCSLVKRYRHEMLLP